MEINGKYLGWAIIHLVMFIYMIFTDLGITKLTELILPVILTIFFLWRFIENMKKSFYKENRMVYL